MSRPRPPRGGEFHAEDANPLGALALFLLGSGSVYYTYNLYRSGCPCFALYPALASIFGAGIGFLWEIRGGPLLWLPAVQSLRRANVGLILGFTAYLVFATSSPWNDESTAVYKFLLSFGIPFYGAWLLMYSWLGQESWRTALGIPGSLLFFAAVAGFAPNRNIMDPFHQIFFVAYLLLMMFAFLVAGTVPPKYSSFVFRGSLAVSVILSYIGVSGFHFNLEDFGSDIVSFEKCTMFESAGSVCRESIFKLNLRFFVGVLSGLVVAINTSKLVFYEFRYRAVSPIWTLLHWFLLSSNGPYPQRAPAASDEIKNVIFNSYEKVHPNASPLSVPSATFIPLAQRFDYGLLRIVFGVTNWGDKNMPVAVIDELPANKPRTDFRLGMNYYWNSKLLRNPAPQAPKEMQSRFGNGELLSYALLYSNGFREVREPTLEEVDFVEKTTGTTPNRVLDYTKYERFDNREGFSRYGGKAFFVALNKDSKPCIQDGEEVHSISLIGVVGPQDPMEAFVSKVANDGLKQLQEKWEEDREIHDCIDDHMRVMPKELHVMAGY